MSDVQDKAFLEMIVKAIVGHPEKVEVDRTVDEMGVLLTLKIDSEDMGYVIGRRGQTAQAIRTLLKIIGAKNNARVNLKIHEPEGSTRVRKERPEGSDRPARAPRTNDTDLEDPMDVTALENLTM